MIWRMNEDFVVYDTLVRRTTDSEAFANSPYGDGIVCFSARLVYVVYQCY